MNRARFAVVGIGLVLLGIIGWGWHAYRAKEAQRRIAEQVISERDARITTLEHDLAASAAFQADLEESLRTERKKNEAFENQIARISGTVGRLEKLSQTDPELLQQYSKIYFLNENYEPSALTDIPKSLVSPAAVRTPLSFHAEALPYLESMLEAAKEDGVDLAVISAYRSFGTQAQLKSSYRVTYGSGANAFSADQGYSEHQLGTTVDLTTAAVGGTFTGFEKTDAYAWLLDHAQRYGFILSYPPGNASYQYEPWHWRFVGTDLARDLKREGRHFYELDQRELDAYLGEIFD